MFYPEYVYTARLQYLEEEHGYGPDSFEKDGIGFYTIRFEMKFSKPIPASESQVSIESFAETLEGSLFRCKYSIRSADEAVEYSTGNFDFFAVDLKTQKPLKAVPEKWLNILFE